ncbi:3275_t:CDS:2 [Acaulospora colombiana]|uniref:3275_t:CDS:1 n=1 Tax=Acaulospora colombiana TaxID=27376 RepID=A0ACA9M2J7_9GLOM|nr:3275_t:CDS:2 [Acaulospora colombiana]
MDSKEKAIKEFEDVFPILAEEFLDSIQSRSFSSEAVEWIKKNIFHNVPGGNRSISLFKGIVIWLVRYSKTIDGKVTEEELFKARILGWCVEWLQAFFLVADDIMDSSLTRRGNKCWYKMASAGIKNEIAFQKAKDILLPLGEYFQIQDDYLDCFGLPEIIGKIGTDIEDNKCSWCINKALLLATPEQRKILEENYGRKNPQNVAEVKKIYKKLEIEKEYKAYEEESFAHINGLISQLDESILKKDVFVTFANKIYKRNK